MNCVAGSNCHDDGWRECNEEVLFSPSFDEPYTGDCAGRIAE